MVGKKWKSRRKYQAKRVTNDISYEDGDHFVEKEKEMILWYFSNKMNLFKIQNFNFL